MLYTPGAAVIIISFVGFTWWKVGEQLDGVGACQRMGVGEARFRIMVISKPAEVVCHCGGPGCDRIWYDCSMLEQVLADVHRVFVDRYMCPLGIRGRYGVAVVDLPCQIK